MQYAYVTPLLEISSVILVAGQIKSKPYIWSMPMLPVSSLVFLSFFFYFYFLTLQYCIGFAIYQHESTTGIHVFPILNPPPSSLPIPSLWVIQCTSPKHSVSSIESGLATCFIYDIIPTPLSRRPYLTGLPPSMPLSTLKAEAKPFLSITLHGPGLATECALHKYS